MKYEPELIPKVTGSDITVDEFNGDLMMIACFTDSFVVTEEESGFESVSIIDSDLQNVNRGVGGALADLIIQGGFKGEKGTSVVTRVNQDNFKYVGLVGLGKKGKYANAIQLPYMAAGYEVAQVAKQLQARKCGMYLLQAVDRETITVVQGVARGAYLGNYRPTAFVKKVKGNPPSMEQITLLGFAGEETVKFKMTTISQMDMVELGVLTGQSIAKGQLLARYLVEAPPNVCTPSFLANTAQKIADDHPNEFECSILSGQDCLEMGMGCYLGVAEASQEEPKFIHLTYKPKNFDTSRVVALVGKGLTFDSGGYNIKAGAGSLIDKMKLDMGGAAAVLGAAQIMTVLQPRDVEVHFIIASCENMIHGNGLRPGDVLKSSKGLTVEVNNTDAEGRLTLCDALWYAQEKCQATTIVDIATLTGACIVALGPKIAGLFCENDELSKKLLRAAETTGDKLWQLPLEQEYKAQLKSSVADMKNAGDRFGGSITAALFLDSFIDKDTVEWAHIDMAGPAFDLKNDLGTGYGAALLANFVQRLVSNLA